LFAFTKVYTAWIFSISQYIFNLYKNYEELCNLIRSHLSYAVALYKPLFKSFKVVWKYNEIVILTLRNITNSNSHFAKYNYVSTSVEITGICQTQDKI
jgi:hypothetical protein